MEKHYNNCNESAFEEWRRTAADTRRLETLTANVPMVLLPGPTGGSILRPPTPSAPAQSMTTRFQLTVGGLICGLSLALNACSDPMQPDASTTKVAVASVKVTPQVVQFFGIGNVKYLTATVSPANATDQTVIWESSDSTVATVDATGRVTAKAVGSGIFITAFTHDGLHEASANISVNL